MEINIIVDNTSLHLCIYVYLHGVQVSLKTVLILISHIGRHEDRKSEMASKGGQCYQNRRLETDLSLGRGEKSSFKYSCNFCADQVFINRS